MLFTVVTAFMVVGAASARIIAGALRHLVFARDSMMLVQVQAKRVVLVASVRNGLIICDDGAGGCGSAGQAAG